MIARGGCNTSRKTAAASRAGKIMRRILRKIAEDESGNLGDTSTLADPAVVDDLVNNRQNRRGA
jgi:acetyl-CoA synthetase